MFQSPEQVAKFRTGGKVDNLQESQQQVSKPIQATKLRTRDKATTDGINIKKKNSKPKTHAEPRTGGKVKDRQES